MTFFSAGIFRRRNVVAIAVAALSFTAAPAMAAEQNPGSTSFIPSPPALAASAWVLMDAASGQVLVEHNANERLPPASLTKMMTAYIAEDEIENGDISLDDQVRISEEAWSTGGSRMFVREGTSVPLIDLMRGIVVQSGNDATVAVAEYIAGSQSAFADLMNEYVRRMGLQNTHFVNPTGWPAPDHYSSAMDLATIARHIIRDFPDHYDLYSEKYFTWNDIRQPNRNRLLWRDPSVDGLKTGHTEAAGYCLVASAKQQDTRLIAVVMGTSSDEARAQETQKLLSYGFRYYETRHLFDAGQPLTEARVWGGTQDQVGLGLADDLYITVPTQGDTETETRTSLDGDLQAPIQAGQQLGTLEVLRDGEVVRSEPLVALSGVEQGGFVKRLWDGLLRFVQGLF
ncbi:D-alanyl-D-alanine carboxypeptidase family protein [Kushneria aurantia]|uniref:serine-type D-Ala-D-Ala carboxypeptidase n=1 Tax=Kushneria aurantia TaxID=504092 RepID=A0ABV6G2L6_9GAMM|nr:D-alanyl-D-alanine carboxypeptidase family protein [Kushneria aurantia]